MEETTAFLNDDACHKLVYEMVILAVEDWKKLCEGAYESKHMNFREIENFFKTDARIYLTGSELTADRILEELQSLREKAGV